jgi:uncharacterized protein (DUF1697 family)
MHAVDQLAAYAIVPIARLSTLSNGRSHAAVHFPFVPRLIAFLRAINVGGHIVKMDHLRTLFEGLGFKNVETFIASGNVIFEHSASGLPALEQKIEKALQKDLGYEVITFLRTPAQVAAIAKLELFPSFAAEDTLYIGFLKSEPRAALKTKIAGLTTATDAFEIHGSEVYWWRRKESEGKYSGGGIEKTLALSLTMRNVTTVRKLAAKYSK